MSGAFAGTGGERPPACPLGHAGGGRSLEDQEERGDDAGRHAGDSD